MPLKWSFPSLHWKVGWSELFSNLCLDLYYRICCWFLDVLSLVVGLCIIGKIKSSTRCNPLDILKSNNYVRLIWYTITSNQAGAAVNSGLLLMAVMGIMFPAVLHSTHSEVQYGKSELSLSRFSSCIMLIAYASYLVFQLKSHHSLYNPIDEVSDFAKECTHICNNICMPSFSFLCVLQSAENDSDDTEEEEAPLITQWESIIWLSILTALVSILSCYLVDAIQVYISFTSKPRIKEFFCYTIWLREQ